jgi:FPC/CPF motif-containing protein YcgG
VVDGRPANGRIQLLHDEFRATVLSSAYPCVLGASVLRARNYVVALYHELGSDHSAHQLAGDIEWFVRNYPVPRTRRQPFTTFVALFDGPSVTGEADFERLLWRHLDLLHGHDRRRWEWDSAVSADPADPYFSFSVSGRAFFVVGMHPKASRVSRLAPLPALVFNRHEQFEVLRARGQMDRMIKIIRARDERLDGRAYSALAQYGEVSEARQYAGREVDADWRCPFAPRVVTVADHRSKAGEQAFTESGGT